VLRLTPDGGYRLDTRLADYHCALEGSFPAAMRALVGPPRAPDEDPTEAHMDLAASVQAAFEAAQRHLLAWGRERCPDLDRLVLSGGCALNVTANGRVLQSGLFREIVAPPAPHDAGCAVGAALAHLHARGASLPRDVASPYLGPAFSDAEIDAAFAGLGLPAPRPAAEDELIAAVVGTLAARGIVAWHQGRTEFGPGRSAPARSSPTRATTPSARRSTARSRSASCSAPSRPR
jgi:carbamoyltransferase